MDHVCVAIPIRPGKSDDARAFMEELERHRLAEYEASERRLGITKELWFLAPSPAGDLLIGYIEAGDFARAAQAFSASQDPFDVWFRTRMLEATGIDFASLPPDFRPAQLLSRYEGPAAV